MTMAATLVEAANLSYSQLALKWTANTLRTATAAFAAAASPVFPDSQDNCRPVGNWMVLIDALVSTLPPAPLPVAVSDLNQDVEYVARMCYAAFTLNAQVPQLVTNAQATALLAAWNAAFGT